MRYFLTVAAAVLLVSCGSTDSTTVPTPPTAKINATSWLVDVGGRWSLDASDSIDPRVTDQVDKNLAYGWTMVHSTSASDFDDYCSDEDVADTMCTSDDDCSEGSCGEGAGDTLESVSYSPDEEGPYTVRLTVSSGLAAGTKVMTLDTYPSLFVAGTLERFGGTAGGAVGALGSNSSFLTGAAHGLSNPAFWLSGRNLLILVTDGAGFGVVREFNYQTGAVVGTFGETASFISDPTAMAFDSSDDLYLADGDGTVAIFDGATGFYQSTYGDDISGPGDESPTAIAFDGSGNLLAVYGAGVGAVYSYDGSSSTAGAVLGDTAGALSGASDLAVVGSTAILVLDPTASAVVSCDGSGTSCSSFSALAGALSGGDSLAAVAANPSAAAASSAAVLVLVDNVAGDGVVACNADGSTCAAFGSATALGTSAADIFFAPSELPTTKTTTTSTTTTTL